ncbi:hypothetical protein OESDEN_14108 [Oesophagostomum dentatum]|uniref:Uncharacterized protein n=1 Tax=Oesophagostomum dentatum TaxID=61180 RepID=A0A0B1SSK9_OESDE|nr:hypothetical protein OESDEN_14108 [Oesophagostomum dentatum]
MPRKERILSVKSSAEVSSAALAGCSKSDEKIEKAAEKHAETHRTQSSEFEKMSAEPQKTPAPESSTRSKVPPPEARPKPPKRYVEQEPESNLKSWNLVKDEKVSFD